MNTRDAAEDLLAFIASAPTPYHAVRQAADRLAGANVERLHEGAAWQLEPGDRRFATRGDGTIVAFVVGQSPPHESGFRIIGAHTDSPNLRLRPRPDVPAGVAGVAQLAVEPYGGVLLHSWLDRDLALAGRVSFSHAPDAAPHIALVRLARPLVRIANLAIHLQRELATDGLRLNPQQHLAPMIGLIDTPHVAELLADTLRADGYEGVAARDILGFDLALHDAQPPALGGEGDAFVYAPRLDNLASCHAAITALIAGASTPTDATRVVVLYDHEEVGSRSAAGAAGTVLEDTLARIAGARADGATDALARARSHSMLVSADMAHAAHPNFVERHEPGHRPLLGAGPVIKVNANQSYATDAVTAGHITRLAREAGIEPQHFVSRSDQPCGSTIGPISAARTGIASVDIGNPMLSMHSCREMAATADVAPMIELLRRFLLSR